MSQQKIIDDLFDKLEKLENNFSEQKVVIKKALTLLENEFDNIVEPSSVVHYIRNGLNKVIKSL